MTQKLPSLNDAYLSRMERLLQEEYPVYLRCLQEPPVKAVRVNTLKHANTVLEGVDMVPSGFAENSWIIRNDTKLGGTAAYLSGTLYPQEPSASLPVTALGIREGMRVPASLMRQKESSMTITSTGMGKGTLARVSAMAVSSSMGSMCG